MANLTPNLGLFKYDELTDQDVTFSFQQALNDNWDILDDKLGNIDAGLEVGDIVFRLFPTKSAGKHLLDGSLIQYGAYKEFVDYIAEIYETREVFVPIQLPVFSSNTVNGITISDSLGNTDILQNLFNGVNGIQQLGSWSTYWVNINYGRETLINSYTMQADNNGSVVECPSAWTLRGSNDGQTWTILDTRSGESFTSGQIRTFNVSTSARYKQYRIVFSAGTEYQSKGQLIHLTFDATAIEKPLFVSQSEWEQSVNTYGVCGKFVYDSVNKTVRLPKITGIIEGTTDLDALGTLIEAGLPNIVGTFDLGSNQGSYFPTHTGPFYSTEEARGAGSQGFNTADSFVNGFNAGLCNSVYGNADTVQPQTIQGLYYIVLTTAVKDPTTVIIDEVMTDLNSKVDKGDLTEIHCITETYVDGASWYRVYSDGWCEMGGQTTTRDEEVTFLKTFADTTYNVVGNEIVNSTVCEYELLIFKLSTNKIKIYCDYGGSYGGLGACWVARGYLAEGQY